MSIWGDVELEPGKDRSVSVGEVELRFARNEADWRVGYFGRIVGDSGLVEGWRTVPGTGLAPPRLLPATPDLPVVLKPDTPVALVPGASVHYEVSLPIWVRVTVAGKRGRDLFTDTLADLPSHMIKRTWFGTPETGEVAYGWRFSPENSRSPRRDEFSVPLTIRNRSESVLWFERLLLRVVHLDLYGTGSGVTSNSVTVSFKGLEQYSQITWGDGQSLIRAGYRKLAGCREPASNDIIRKSFIWLRDLTA